MVSKGAPRVPSGHGTVTTIISLPVLKLILFLEKLVVGPCRIWVCSLRPPIRVLVINERNVGFYILGEVRALMRSRFLVAC